MAISQRLDIRQSQSLVMTPQLQQAIKLLQLSNLELSDYVEEQLQENPLLERQTDDEGAEASERESPQIAGEARDSADVVQDSGDFERQLEAADSDYANVWDDGGGGSDSGLLWSDGRGNAGPDDSDGNGGWEAVTATPTSLREHLLNQVNLEFADPIERVIATAIVDQLDDAGYFAGDFKELAGLTGVDRNTVAWVHSRILQFDPVGIGARSLAECLRLQLNERGEVSPAMDALLENLVLLGKRDFKTLAKRCGVDLASLSQLVETVRSCSPRPATAFDFTPATTLIPDVLVRRGNDGEWRIELNAEALPHVLANREYFATVKSSARSQADIDFITSQWHAANWLVKALEQRANTILKVASCIVRIQGGFLEHGVSGLRPMTMQHAAEEAGVHESTVSRVSNGKYMATPRGIFELKYFFTAGAGSVNGADTQSVEVVRHRIRQLVEAESVDCVLSDESLVEMLHEEGMQVARRTVAKYRESMNIPSSAQRRRLLRLAAS